MRGKIHSLVFLAFTALAVSASGCIIDNTANNDPGCANPLLLTWSIDDNRGNGFLCSDVGASTVSVDAAGVVSEFPCSAYAGETFDVPGGTYLVDVQLLTGNRSLLSEASANWSVPVCGGLDLGPVAFCVGSACP